MGDRCNYGVGVIFVFYILGTWIKSVVVRVISVMGKE